MRCASAGQESLQLDRARDLGPVDGTIVGKLAGEGNRPLVKIAVLHSMAIHCGITGRLLPYRHKDSEGGNPAFNASSADQRGSRNSSARYPA